MILFVASLAAYFVFSANTTPIAYEDEPQPLDLWFRSILPLNNSASQASACEEVVE